MDLDPDPAIFVVDLQDANKRLSFSADYFLKVLQLLYFFKDGRNQGFFLPFLLDDRRIRIQDGQKHMHPDSSCTGTYATNPQSAKIVCQVVDKMRISQVRVATVVDITGRRLQLAYDDSSGGEEGFWCHEESPLIHPVGWARR